MEAEQRCPTDLTDAQWAVLAPLIPPPQPGGHPRTVARRQLVNAMVDIDRTGCQWRMLPRESPNWKMVCWRFTRFEDDGAGERITETLRRAVRQRAGRGAEPIPM